MCKQGGYSQELLQLPECGLALTRELEGYVLIGQLIQGLSHPSVVLNKLSIKVAKPKE